MIKIPCIIRPSKLTVIINGETLNVEATDANYGPVLVALKENDEEAILLLLKPIKSVENKLGGTEFTSDGSAVYFNGTAVQSAIATRMLWMVQNDLSVVGLQNFYKRLQNNPSFRATQELFGFLDACDLPIDDEGFFYGYKKIRADFLDIYTGKMDNSPGKVVQVTRNQVDEDSSRTCSNGLHLCSMTYLPSYGSSNGGDKIVMVKVDPADVVAVPKDYNNAKMRVCKYEVIKEVDSGDIPKYYHPTLVSVSEEEFEEMLDEEIEEFFESDDEPEAGDFGSMIARTKKFMKDNGYDPEALDKVNFEKYSKDNIYDDISDFLLSSMTWDGQEQGSDYWDTLYVLAEELKV